jgi:hypothetical protein
VFPEDLVQEEEDESVLPMTSVLNVKNSAALLGIAANGAFVATLDPTLAYRLSAPPLYYGNSVLATTFVCASIVRERCDRIRINVPCAANIFDRSSGHSQSKREIKITAPPFFQTILLSVEKRNTPLHSPFSSHFKTT